MIEVPPGAKVTAVADHLPEPAWGRPVCDLDGFHAVTLAGKTRGSSHAGGRPTVASAGNVATGVRAGPSPACCRTDVVTSGRSVAAAPLQVVHDCPDNQSDEWDENEQ